MAPKAIGMALLAAMTTTMAAAGPLRVGYAKTAITPAAPGQYIAGYGSNRVAEGSHDDIWARAMALSDGEDLIVLVACDLLGIFMPDRDKIVRNVPRVPSENVVVTCTHVHSAPDVLGLWGPTETTSGVDPAYLAMVKERIADVINQAAGESMVRCKLRFARAAAPEKTGYNVRERDLIDPEIGIMQVLGMDGEAICTLVNYACHPEVLTTESKLITSDFVHYLREEMEGAGTGDVLFVNGALGGMVTPEVEEHSFAEAERVGRALGQAALGAMADEPGVTEVADADIEIGRATFSLPFDNQKLAMAAEIGLIDRKPSEDGTITTTVVAGRIGPAQFASMPGEALPVVGLAVKEMMDAEFRLFFGLADDELGYLLHAEAVDNQKYRYEQSMSVNRNAVPVLMEQLEALMAR